LFAPMGFQVPVKNVMSCINNERNLEEIQDLSKMCEIYHNVDGKIILLRQICKILNWTLNILLGIVSVDYTTWPAFINCVNKHKYSK